MTTAASILILLAAGMGAYGWWAVEMHRAGVPVVALLGNALLLYAGIVAAVTVLWFAIAWIYRAKRPPAAQLGLAGTLRLFTQEFLTLAGSPWRMGVGWWFMREPRHGPAASPVLLVHGVLCNSGVWMGMRGALARRGVGPIYTISYGPPFASIDDFADQLAAKIDAIFNETGAASVSLVAHSMGGLVARAYVRRYGAERLARVITIGTPHAGSVHAWLCPGTSLAQLRCRSDWLDKLNAHGSSAVPIVSIWSWHDSMVAPQDSSRLHGARDVPLVGIGHNALLRDARVVDAVVAALSGDDHQALAHASGAHVTSESPASAARTPSAPG